MRNSWLGEIKELHGTISPVIQSLVDKKLEAGQAEALLMYREIDAINCAKKIAESYVGKHADDITIIMIYGGAHDFSPYCEREGFELETIDTFYLSYDSQDAIAILDEKIAILTRQLKQHPSDEDSRGMFKWILERKQALLGGAPVSEIESVPTQSGNKRLLEMVSSLGVLRLEDSLAHKQLLAEVEIWQEKNKQLSIELVIAAIQSKDYSLALRQACALGNYELIKLVSKYDLHLVINYQATSPLDWLTQAQVDDEVKSEIKSLLIERMKRAIATEPAPLTAAMINVHDSVSCNSSAALGSPTTSGQGFFKQDETPAQGSVANVSVFVP